MGSWKRQTGVSPPAETYHLPVNNKRVTSVCGVLVVPRQPRAKRGQPSAGEFHDAVNIAIRRIKARGSARIDSSHREFSLARKGPEQRQLSREISVMYRRDPQERLRFHGQQPTLKSISGEERSMGRNLGGS